MTWHVDNNGVIYNKNRQPIGYFDINGDVYDKSGIGAFGQPNGYPVGFVDIVGDAYNQIHSHVGFADLDGLLYDQMNTPIGAVALDGNVYDAGKKLIGFVDPSLHERIHRTSWRLMHFRAAAAVVLVLYITKGIQTT